MRKSAILAAALVVLVPASLLAEGDDDVRIKRIEAAYKSWLETAGTSGVLSISKGGEAVKTVAVGPPPEVAVETASLSKSITAICAAELVKAGKLGWEQTFDQVYGSGPALTIGSLVTHTTGIGLDSTQVLMPEWLDTEGNRSEAVLAEMEKRDNLIERPGAFGYNNENYALLGLAIEAASGRPYAETCTELALAPAGAAAFPSDRAGGFLPWGGWQMSAADYGKFFTHWYNQDLDPFAYPNVEAGGGAYYGLGMLFRSDDAGQNYWHFGALCFPGKLNTGSYTVTWKGGWALSAFFADCVDWDNFVLLDASMIKAALEPLE